MQTKSLDGLTLFFEEGESEAAKLIGDASRDSIALIHDQWRLETPEDCRVYVMTSWPQFMLHPTPLHYRLSLIVWFPFYYSRVRRLWNVAGGLSIRYGKRRVVGIKPARLIKTADRSIGKRIFVEQANEAEKIRHITCHELTHAFTSHLRLPMWLNEGLAMVTVDLLAGRPTVRAETLKTLERSANRASPGNYLRVSLRDEDAVVYHTVRGYWIARYMLETQPELLRSLLARRLRRGALESKVAAAYDLTRETFWRTIDGRLVSYFGKHGR